MSIEVLCGECGQSLRAAESHVGKKARCPKCSAAVLIQIPVENEIKLSPLKDETSQTATDAAGPVAADEGGMFAGLEVDSPDEIQVGDLSGLANLDSGADDTAAPFDALASPEENPLDADDMRAAQPGALDEAITEQPAAAPVRLSPSAGSGVAGGLSAIADTADEMQSSVQAVAFTTLGGCGLATVVGVFWIARSAPEGIWPFTVAGVSLMIVAAVAGLAVKNLLAYYKRIDAFAEKEGSKELARQMSAAKRFWKSAMLATIAALVLAIVSLLAFAFVPVEHKNGDKDKDQEASRTAFASETIVS